MKPLEMIEQGRFLGEEFVLWLWKRGVSDGGTSGIEGDHSACLIDDSVKLVSEHGDVKEVSLRKGNPAESHEAFDALAKGMRPAQVKIRLMKGEMEWTFTMAPALLALHLLKPPPAQSKGVVNLAAERIFLIYEGIGLVQDRFRAFLRLRVEDPEGLQTELKGWISDGLNGLVIPVDPVLEGEDS